MTMLGSSWRAWRAFRCWVDRLALGGFAFRRAALTPSLSVSADLWSSLRAMASVAEMISSRGICLGAMAKDRRSARTSSSDGESGLELRLTTSLFRSSVGCDKWFCVFWEFKLLNFRICLSLTAWCSRCPAFWQYLSILDHWSAFRDWERSDSRRLHFYLFFTAT